MAEPQVSRSPCESMASQVNMDGQRDVGMVDVKREVDMAEIDRAELEESVMDVCRQSPEGVDLLVSSFVQSLRSYRRPTVCAPFPTTFFRKGSEQVEKDFFGAENCVAHFPRIGAIAAAARLTRAESNEVDGRSQQGQQQNANRNPLQCLPLRALYLLHWIVTCRRRLRLVEDPASEIAHMLPPGTSPWAFSSAGASQWLGSAVPHVVLEVAPPDVVQPFDLAKAQNGSFMAYHGTSAENLHSIIRCGLQNMSGTPLQRTGAAFGEGIYLCVDPTVALNYCSAGEGWERSCFGPRARYLLVCEVANGVGVMQGQNDTESACARVDESGDDSRHPPRTYIVARNGDMVRLRYLLVYSEPSRCSSKQKVGGSLTQFRRRFGGVRTSREGGGNGFAGGNGPDGMSGVVFDRASGDDVNGDDAPGYDASGVPIPVSAPRTDWCKIIIFAYIALLIAVGFWNQSSRHHGLSHFFYHLMS
ncbi:hypothetical protein CBR_g23408 [Chara braunii]|uniref:Poly [ADP-ribose] polymerase n=1 Tax=Chara braunii TaxID=69332 RepID=A0A388L4A9_CHABU|nr:hypothetical protein CBR_g23408 [Chara braunii]|eukprot:GBG77082.1 hypothetical protein CBR_g23408 [Chara braunii]